MRVAFYAPLKSPNHPVPSGERTIARNLMSLLEGSGVEVLLASQLRTREPKGDAAAQAVIMAQADVELARLLTAMQADPPTLWVTYHNYYKAPDLLGPRAAKALGVPYVLIESTRAQKRLGGDWDAFARAAEAASDAADVAFHFTEHDGVALRRDAPKGQNVTLLRPFLGRAMLPCPLVDPAQGHDDATGQSVGFAQGPMLTVGMFRHRDKLDSYRILAETLAHIRTPDWRLQVAGDGPARDEVAALFAPFGARVDLLGQLGPTELQRAYDAASIFIWPGVNEGFGMVYLEAQAAGLPCVAQDRPGVRDVVYGPGLVPVTDGARGLAAAIDVFLSDAHLRVEQARSVRAEIERHHLQCAAARSFWIALQGHLGLAP